MAKMSKVVECSYWILFTVTRPGQCSAMAINSQVTDCIFLSVSIIHPTIDNKKVLVEN